MTPDSLAGLAEHLNTLTGADKVPLIVDEVLRWAIEWSASDVHIEPTADSVWIRLRLDGVLQEVGHLEKNLAPNLAARIKVLADLLSYKTDIPQEGSIRRDRLVHLLAGREFELQKT